MKHAAEVRDALYQSSHVTNAHHLIYAYSVMDESGMKITSHSDDGEWAASRLLANLLTENSNSNIFIAVSRRHDGPNLGRQRFTYITDVGKEAIQLL